MKKLSSTSEAQKCAHAMHDDIRKELPRLPGTRIMSEENAHLMERLYSRIGTKYEVLIEASKLWLSNLK